ncbi:hypothetical protein OESDEN_22904 [Oesophagostomum dentatum]|uniref:Uncharacterized protein n=1 Tax=Oesophagostomum dentatum TaxID=61180 RepID=A0A0B1S0Q0_OESDE|nr:hypothetical protein OESDEN_22904 [Oesophagostomum dentatum]
MDQWCNVDPRPQASSSLTLLVTDTENMKVIVL